jgi:hypothetical protein
MTKIPTCEECGQKFGDPGNLADGLKRFCSDRCRMRAYYRKHRAKLRERESARYHSDPEYRGDQIARTALNKRRRKSTKPQ